MDKEFELSPISEPKKISVLGTEYDVIESDEEHDKSLKGKDGYCDTSITECVVDKMEQNDVIELKKNLVEYKKLAKRHEIVHAFLFESGLDICSSWARNEEMVDWIALQFPKMKKAFEEADCL